jgi:hypothetical protein
MTAEDVRTGGRTGQPHPNLSVRSRMVAADVINDDAAHDSEKGQMRKTPARTPACSCTLVGLLLRALSTNTGFLAAC